MGSVSLQIDATRCVRCGKCAWVCPSEILRQEEKGGEIRVQHSEECIACGHCVAVCAKDAIQHSAFPDGTTHPIDYAQLPTADQLFALMQARRSNRALTSRPVPHEALERIVEAATLAPTATNARLLSFTVVTDPEQLRAVAGFTIQVFDKLANLLLNPVVKCLVKPFQPELYEKYAPMFASLKEAYAKGEDPILRKATALLIIHSPKSNRFGAEEANLAYQNASLMAESMGVSQIYMGFVLTAIRQAKKGAFSRLLGIEGEVFALMGLGMPAFRYPRSVDHREQPVRFL
ncbi:MAG: nitroreductase family protein [Parabacteroides sp.]|nr:nitroreductase family protein [Parabacteroides sp.]MCI7009106.1 nitroreductase family protein [Parabacteroides sp.]MDD6081186.1 nitroreductase family protein [bacterium]